jgi:hypothetical protein
MDVPGWCFSFVDFVTYFSRAGVPCFDVLRGLGNSHVNSILTGLGSFLDIDGTLLTHGSHDNDVCYGQWHVLRVWTECVLTDVLAVVKHLLDLLADLTIGNLDIILGVAGIVHKGKEVIIGDIQLFLCQKWAPRISRIL